MHSQWEQRERVLERAGALAGRRYAATFVPYCHAGEHGQMHVGVVHDRARLELLAHRALTPGEACPRGRPPGLVAHLRPAEGAAFVLVSIHFKAGGLDADQAERRRQWTWLARALPELSAERSAPVVVAGDFNSTGFLDRDHAERRFIEGLVAERGLRLPTRDLACSMYWTPSADRYEVSLLDHVLGPADLELARAEVLGMCAALACAPQPRAPASFDTISDHCPVRVELRR